MNKENIIKLQDVTKQYESGKIIALNHVNIEIKQGKIIGVIGRNGAGKSTMFKTICGLITPDSGSVEIMNNDNKIDFISYLPEVRGLDTRQIVGEHLVDMLCYKGIRRREATKMIEKWLKEFDMYEYRNRLIESLSKGNQQKLQFISAIANEPEVIILDEPFSGLDAITSDFLWEKIVKLKEQGSTILYSTHNLNDKLLLSDSFIFVVDGNIVEQGHLSDIQNRHEMVLEINSDNVTEKDLYKYVPKEKIRKVGESFLLKVDKEQMAEEIFEQLGRPFCRTFCIRKLSIAELFRLLNKMEE